MQLFSIGLFIQNQDGTDTLDEAGAAIPSYTNENIVEFARIWTGFKGRDLRGNIEQKRIATANQVRATHPSRILNFPSPSSFSFSFSFNFNFPLLLAAEM